MKTCSYNYKKTFIKTFVFLFTIHNLQAPCCANCTAQQTAIFEQHKERQRRNMELQYLNNTKKGNKETWSYQKIYYQRLAPGTTKLG